ncbi:uncharacterized protein LOC120339310 [Styela clava]
MKIICAGFWKTGTKSLAEALTILGYKVYDYDYQLFEFPDLWNKLFDGEITDDKIREELKNVDALIDGPVIAFWEDISRAFPESKVILTTRDENKWFNSLIGMMNKTPAIFKYFYPLMILTPTGRKFLGTGSRVWSYCLGDDNWNFELEQLDGKDIPDIPYPHKNKEGAHFAAEGGPQHPKFRQLMLELMFLLGIFASIISYIFYILYIYICT